MFPYNVVVTWDLQTKQLSHSLAHLFVPDSNETGFHETSEEHVKAVSFVGGNAAGKHIYERAGLGK